jgi:membrane-associated HD superfamily phosphohydrolase
MPAVLTLLIGAVNLIVSLTILNLSNGSENYIIYMLSASAVFIIIQSFFLNAYCFYRVYPEEKAWKSATIFIKILTVLLITITFSEFYTHFVKVNSLIKLVVGITIVAIFCASVGFTLIINSLQRLNFLNFIKKVKFSTK